MTAELAAGTDARHRRGRRSRARSRTRLQTGSSRACGTAGDRPSHPARRSSRDRSCCSPRPAWPSSPRVAWSCRRPRPTPSRSLSADAVGVGHRRRCVRPRGARDATRRGLGLGPVRAPAAAHRRGAADRDRAAGSISPRRRCRCLRRRARCCSASPRRSSSSRCSRRPATWRRRSGAARRSASSRCRSTSGWPSGRRWARLRSARAATRPSGSWPRCSRGSPWPWPSRCRRRRRPP